MINVAALLTPTAPGPSAKGGSAVGGDLFASSMLAIGAAGIGRAAGMATPSIAADPTRQALAVPGMPLPIADAAAIDPALAWLPAVNIAVPAPLDIPAALASSAPAPVARSATRRDGASFGVLAAMKRPIGVAPSVGMVSAATAVPNAAAPMAGATAAAHPLADTNITDASPSPAPEGDLAPAKPVSSGREVAAVPPSQPGTDVPDANMPDAPTRRPDGNTRADRSPGRGPAAPVATTADEPACAVTSAVDRSAEPSERTESTGLPPAMPVAPLPPLAMTSPIDVADPATPPVRDEIAPELPSAPVHAAPERQPFPRPLRSAEPVDAPRAPGVSVSAPATRSARGEDRRAPDSPRSDDRAASPVAPPVSDAALALPSSARMPLPAHPDVANDEVVTAAVPAPIGMTPAPVAQQPVAAPRPDTDLPPAMAKGAPPIGPRRPGSSPQVRASVDMPAPSAPAQRADPSDVDRSDDAEARASADREQEPASVVVPVMDPVAAHSLPPQPGPVDAAPSRVARTAAHPRALDTASAVNTAQPLRSNGVRPLATDPSPVSIDAAMAAPLATMADTVPATAPGAPANLPSTPSATLEIVAVPAARTATENQAALRPSVTNAQPLSDPVATASDAPASLPPVDRIAASIAPEGPMPASTKRVAPEASVAAGPVTSAPNPASRAIASQALSVPTIPAAAASPDAVVAVGRPIQGRAPATIIPNDAAVVDARPAGIPAPDAATQVAMPVAAALADRPPVAGLAPARIEAAPVPAPVQPAAPILAVAAPVPVVGAVASPMPQPVAPLADIPVAPRSSFVREVAGTPRQTVALRPRMAAPPQPLAGVTAPASQVFGAAIHAASGRDERDRVAMADPSAVATGPTPVPVRDIAPVADTGQPSLDMRQQTWPTTMIDHIEALRDAANANDTRIRLVPDALGAIDVAVKTVGDAIHVRFSADDATTRAMIEEARPGLVLIAEERGLKIGQAIVEAGPTQPASANPQSTGASPSGNGQQQAAAHGQGQGQGQGQAQGQAQPGQQQPRQQHTSTTRQPATAARAPSNDTDAAGNGRIA